VAQVLTGLRRSISLRMPVPPWRRLDFVPSGLTTPQSWPGLSWFVPAIYALLANRLREDVDARDSRSAVRRILPFRSTLSHRCFLLAPSRRSCPFSHGGSWPIVLKKDFEGVAAQFRFKKSAASATLIRISGLRDSIVAYTPLTTDFFNTIGPDRRCGNRSVGERSDENRTRRRQPESDARDPLRSPSVHRSSRDNVEFGGKEEPGERAGTVIR